MVALIGTSFKSNLRLWGYKELDCLVFLLYVTSAFSHFGFEDSRCVYSIVDMEYAVSMHMENGSFSVTH